MRVGGDLRAVLETVYGDSVEVWQTILARLRALLECETVSLLVVASDGALLGYLQHPGRHAGPPLRSCGTRHRHACPLCAAPAWTVDRYGVSKLSAERRQIAVIEVGKPVLTGRIMFARAEREFTEDDRMLIGLLRPHLDLAFRRSEELRSSSVLTPRQQEVLGLVALGHSNAEIATHLQLSVGTVRKHLENIFAALEVPNRAAAAMRGARPDWVSSTEPGRSG